MTNNIAKLALMGARAQVDRENVIHVAAQKFSELGEDAFAEELCRAVYNPAPFLEKYLGITKLELENAGKAGTPDEI